MSAEILENTLSPQGMHWMHLLQLGAPVDLEPIMQRISWYSRPLVQTQRQIEDGLDLHHLRVWWQAREMVTVDGGGPDWLRGHTALLWWIDRGQTLREAVMYAGIAYMDYVGCWPTWALVQAIPTGATKTVTVYEDNEEHIAVQLGELPGLAHGFILMCEESQS